MKKIILALAVLAGALAPARAGVYYELKDNTNYFSLRVGYSGAASSTPFVFWSSGTAVFQSTSSTSGYYVMRAKNYAGTDILTLTQGGVLAVPGGITGTASLATALAANGANCSAGSFPLGVDASGAAESCTALSASNAGTATALAANGANCSAGTYPLGVDASGAAESCGSDINGNSLTASTAATSGLPQHPGGTISTAYTTVLGDANRVLVHPASDTSARTWTIDSYANVAYSTGTTLTFVNLTGAGTLTLALSSGQSFCLIATGGSCNTTSRTLAAPGIATAMSISSTTWVLTGNSNLQ